MRRTAEAKHIKKDPRIVTNQRNMSEAPLSRLGRRVDSGVQLGLVDVVHEAGGGDGGGEGPGPENGCPESARGLGGGIKVDPGESHWGWQRGGVD